MDLGWIDNDVFNIQLLKINSLNIEITSCGWLPKPTSKTKDEFSFKR